MRSATDRFTGTFSADGETIEGHWERLDGDRGWQLELLADDLQLVPGGPTHWEMWRPAPDTR